MGASLDSHRYYTRSFIAALLLVFGMWYWAIHLYAPQNIVKAVASGRPVGNNSDLYARWLGAREALLHGVDPYSDEMTDKIQEGFYGRKLDPQSGTDSLASESFTYPLYVVFILSPTVGIPFPVVAGIFRWILLLCIAGAVPLWMYSLGFQPHWLAKISGMLLAVSTVPAVQEYFQQNLSALVILLLAAATAAIVRNRLVLGGILLALATIKPDISAIFVFWFLLWAASDWHRRRRFTLSFAVSMCLLVLAAEVVSPGWIEEFLVALHTYQARDLGPSIFEVFLPAKIAVLVAIGLMAVLVFVCWKYRKEPAGSEQFRFVLVFVASSVLVLLPAGGVYNQFLLIPAFIMFTLLPTFGSSEHPRWNASRIFAKAAIVCQAWQWAVALLLSVASIFIKLPRPRTLIPLPCYTLFTLVPLAFVAIGLCKFRSLHFVGKRT